MYVYACMYACVYVCIRIHMYTGVYMCICMFVYALYVCYHIYTIHYYQFLLRGIEQTMIVIITVLPCFCNLLYRKRAT